MHSGVPLYRQLIDQVQAAIATEALLPGDQLPTVRQVAVDLEINPNTVMRAYREMEIRGILDTQQGTGTFVPSKQSNAMPSSTPAAWSSWSKSLLPGPAPGGFNLEELMMALRDRWEKANREEP